jgi:hypothetical protein
MASIPASSERWVASAFRIGEEFDLFIVGIGLLGSGIKNRGASFI